MRLYNISFAIRNEKFCWRDSSILKGEKKHETSPKSFSHDTQPSVRQRMVDNNIMTQLNN